MRLKRWQREQYPPNWEVISQAFRASHHYTCEHCGVVQGTLRRSRAGFPHRVRVAAAHKYPNDTQNPDPELLCLCERCHVRYDAQFFEVMEEGEHQAVLHGIVLEQWYSGEEY